MGVFAILLWIIGLFVLYLVIFYAVRDGINKSDIAKILAAKYVEEKPKPAVTNEEIEKEFE